MLLTFNAVALTLTFFRFEAAQAFHLFAELFGAAPAGTMPATALLRRALENL